MPADWFFAVGRHQNFRFEKKKGTKKGQCLFFAGGKRKKRARRRERILEVQVSEVETCCVQVESRKKMTLTFLQKKKPSRFAQCANLWFRLTPQHQHLSFGEKMGLLEVGLATGNSQGPR